MYNNTILTYYYRKNNNTIKTVGEDVNKIRAV